MQVFSFDLIMQDNVGVYDFNPFLVHNIGIEAHLIHVRLIYGELVHFEEQGVEHL